RWRWPASCPSSPPSPAAISPAPTRGAPGLATTAPPAHDDRISHRNPSVLCQQVVDLSTRALSDSRARPAHRRLQLVGGFLFGDAARTDAAACVDRRRFHDVFFVFPPASHRR